MNISRRDTSWMLKWFGHAAPMGEKKNTEFLAGKLEGKRPLGRPSRRWEDIIKVVIKWDGRA